MSKALPAVAWFSLLLFGLTGLGEEPRPTPAVRVRLVEPDEQARAVMELFEGSKAPHPAAALAAWKRASAEPNRLGKPLEALIAALNPRMVGELKALDGAEISIRFDPESGQPSWSAILTHDDGTFSALATAMVLTGGAAEAPLGGLAVDRLGPPGSPLMARAPGGTLLATSRDGLKLARERLDDPPAKAPGEGLHASIEPEALKGASSLALRRLAELIRPSPKARFREQWPPLALDLSLTGETLLALLTHVGEPPIEQAAIDPAWLDWVPADRAMLGFAVGTDPAAKSWDAVFGLADRLEKLDPARGELASIQIRLDLAARVVGIRSESDVLLHLRGLSGWVGSDGKVIDGALLMLHLDDPMAAERLVAKVKTVPGSGPLPPIVAGRSRSLGVVDGRSLRISRVDQSVILTWGDGVLDASMEAHHHPARSAGPGLRESWLPDLKTTMAGAIWPGRLPGVWPEGSPLEKAMADSPPISLQQGRLQDIIGFLKVSWPNLDATVKRFLDLIPLDQPPDR